MLKSILLPVLLRQQQPCIFRRTRQSLRRRCRLCIEVGGRTLNICSKLVRNPFFFFRNTPVVLLYFQHQSDPFWRSVVMQGRISDIQFLENKSLFWSSLSPHEVWVWSFTTLCIVYDLFVWAVCPEGRVHKQNWSDGLTSRPLGFPLLKWTDAHIDTWNLETNSRRLRLFLFFGYLAINF
jgi:hypothetical protein